ncbi:MAG: DUF1186 domain-containing protein [Clostridium sp.]|nr:DUF1186 domain-containing protein [Clostridium sp.]
MRSSINKILQSIEYYDENFPEDAIEELLNREEESRDYLFQYMEEFMKNIFKHLSEDDYIGHIYAVILLAKFKEKKLCPLFLDLLRLPGTRIYELFDTIIPEYGARIIASVYDGNIDNILKVLNDKKANEYAKAVTIQGLKILCINKKISIEKLEDFLIGLLRGNLKDRSQVLLLEILYAAFELKMDRVLLVLKQGCQSGEYKWALSVDEIEAEIKLYEDGMYLNTGIDDVHNQEIIDAISELKNIFKMIEEKHNLKKQAKQLQDIIIEEINSINKKFRRGISSVNFKNQLESLTKKELCEIAKTLELTGYYKLNKEQLIILIYDNYKEVIKNKLDAFDENRIKKLMQFMKCGGIRKVERSKDFATFFYFENYGLVFPFSCKEEATFIMPDLVIDIIRKTVSEFNFRKRIKTNSKIIILVKGMIEAYGIISLEDLIEKLRIYGIEESDEQLIKVINEGSGIYYSVMDKDYILNESITDYSVIQEIEKTKDKYDYKIFTKEELESMGREEWIDNVDYAKRFYDRFIEEFIIERNDLINIVNDMKNDVQIVDADAIIQFMVDSIDNKCENQAEVDELKKSKKIVKKLVREFLENVPLWKYKGRSLKEMKTQLKDI